MKKIVLILTISLPLFASAQYFDTGGYQGKNFGNQTATHNIQLEEGWNAVSSYIIPTSYDFAEVVAPVDLSLILALDRQRSFIPYAFDNTLKTWDKNYGVWIKMEEMSTLTVYGSYQTGATLSIIEPILMPVLSSFPVDPLLLFDDQPLDFIKDVSGNGIYFPEYGINDLEALYPGKTYKVFPMIGFEVEFPTEPMNFSPTETRNNRKDVTITPQSHTIIFSYEALQKITPDDKIYAETQQGFMAAELMVEYNENPLSMNIFGDDTTTTDIDGFANQELINLFCLHMETREIFQIIPDFNNNYHNGNYNTDAISVIDDLALVSVGNDHFSNANRIRVYPNPASIHLNIQGKHIKMINILSISGMHLISKQSKKELNIINTSQLPTGIYLLKIVTSNGVIMQKVVIEH